MLRRTAIRFFKTERRIHACLSSFARLGLPEQLVERLAALRFVTPTDIQLQAIPKILRGSDVILHSPTGSGKTLAYLLPVVARQLEKEKPSSTLIVVPTRVLAIQIAHLYTTLTSELKSFPSTLRNPFLLYSLGTESGPENEAVLKQLLSITPGSVLLATPNRLLGVLKQADDQTLSSWIGQIGAVIVDEIDAMVKPLSRYATLGKRQQRALHVPACTQLLDLIITAPIKPATKPPRAIAEPQSSSTEKSKNVIKASQPPPSVRRNIQFLAVSATVNSPLRRLLATHNWTTSPHVLSTEGVFQVPSAVEHKLSLAADDDKFKLDALHKALTELRRRAIQTIVVFVDPSQTPIDPVITWLQEHGIPAVGLHHPDEGSQQHMFERLTHPQAWSTVPKVGSVVVANQASARGLDLFSGNVESVVLVDLPKTPNAYLHLAGRTGRMGKRGMVVTIVTAGEIRKTQSYARSLALNFSALFPEEAVELAKVETRKEPVVFIGDKQTKHGTKAR